MMPDHEPDHADPSEPSHTNHGWRSVMGEPRRIVVKVGSSTLSATIDGKPYLDLLVDEVAGLWSRGFEVTIVTSGAVACGMQRLGFSERPRELAKVQALAAVGQADLMGRYGASFLRYGRQAGQILLTHEDIARRHHFLSLRHTFAELVDLGVVPIVNENDTVATEELRFGDNDRLAAAFATVLEADLVILLSDIPCLYDRDPRTDSRAQPIREVPRIDDQVKQMAGKAGSGVGTGGMVSKIEAALIAVEAGIPLIIALGADPTILPKLIAGEPLGTLFHPHKRVDRRRHWIGFLSKLQGIITVDAGAVRALRERPASLLPIGVIGVDGHFSAGDGVEIRGPDQALIGRGLVGYDAKTLESIRGLRSDAVAERLGRQVIDPVVHRNDLVLAS
jgi:glutamate 5-kinase